MLRRVPEPVRSSSANAERQQKGLACGTGERLLTGIELSFHWSRKCRRRLSIRYERMRDIPQSFTVLASSVICLDA